MAEQREGVQTQSAQGAKAATPQLKVEANPAAANSGLRSQPRKPEAGIASGQPAVPGQQQRALVPVAPAGVAEEEAGLTINGPQVSLLPVELDVSVPLRTFRVRDLLALDKGRLVESEWSNSVDLPLAAGTVQLAWTEFEVIESQLVVRLTRLV